MINLLPTAYADSIRFGRQNTKLRVWLAGMCAAILGMVIIIAGGWVYISQQSKTLQRNIDTTNQQLKAQKLSQVQADAKQITGDVRVINRVLSGEVRFSELIQAIGQDMPPGTVLSGLSLSDKITGGLDLTAGALTNNDGAQVAINLSQAQNNLFSKVDIVGITCNSAKGQTYPCTATFRALFSKDAQIRFLSVPKGSAQ